MEKIFSLNGMRFMLNDMVISDFDDDDDAISMSDTMEHNTNTGLHVGLDGQPGVPMAPKPKAMEVTIRPSLHNKHLSVFQKHVQDVMRNPEMEFKMQIANQQKRATNFRHCRMLRSSMGHFFNPEPPFYVFSFQDMMEEDEA